MEEQHERLRRVVERGEHWLENALRDGISPVEMAFTRASHSYNHLQLLETINASRHLQENLEDNVECRGRLLHDARAGSRGLPSVGRGQRRPFRARRRVRHPRQRNNRNNSQRNQRFRPYSRRHSISGRSSASNQQEEDQRENLVAHPQISRPGISDVNRENDEHWRPGTGMYQCDICDDTHIDTLRRCPFRCPCNVDWVFDHRKDKCKRICDQQSCRQEIESGDLCVHRAIECQNQCAICSQIGDSEDIQYHTGLQCLRSVCFFEKRGHWYKDCTAVCSRVGCNTICCRDHCAICAQPGRAGVDGHPSADAHSNGFRARNLFYCRKCDEEYMLSKACRCPETWIEDGREGEE